MPPVPLLAKPEDHNLLDLIPGQFYRFTNNDYEQAIWKSHETGACLIKSCLIGRIPNMAIFMFITLVVEAEPPYNSVIRVIYDDVIGYVFIDKKKLHRRMEWVPIQDSPDP